MTTQQAAESNQLVTSPITSAYAKSASDDNDGLNGHLVTHALRSEGADASEDGTGRGTPLVVCGIIREGMTHGDPIPILEAGARTGKSTDDPRAGLGIGEPGDPMFTLQGGKQHAIAFSSKDSGADAGEIAPTLRAQNFDKSHINGGGQVAIAFAQNTRDEVRIQGDGQISGALANQPGMKQQTYVALVEGAHGLTETEITGSVQSNGGKPGQGYQAVRGNFGVRRLTPVECCRLQGFPDDWFEGTGLSDSSKYRCLGNAVAVPVAEWIGKRIMEALCQKS